MTQPLAALGFPDVDRREDQIMLQALQLVREGGLPALTMKKVAERVGFTEAAAYRYFPTKRDLVRGIVARIGEASLSAVRAIAEREDLAPRDRLERIVHAHLDLVRRTEGLPVLLLAEAASTGDAELLREMRSALDSYLAILESLLPERHPGTEPLERHDGSLLLFALAAVLAIRLRLGGDPAAEEGVPARLLPFVVRALAGDSGGES
jgi:AcrR family transcriptional regulator